MVFSKILLLAGIVSQVKEFGILPPVPLDELEVTKADGGPWSAPLVAPVWVMPEQRPLGGGLRGIVQGRGIRKAITVL